MRSRWVWAGYWARMASSWAGSRLAKILMRVASSVLKPLQALRMASMSAVGMIGGAMGGEVW